MRNAALHTPSTLAASSSPTARIHMASGFGVKGGKGRCFDFWLDFSDCLVCAPASSCAVPLPTSRLHRSVLTRLRPVKIALQADAGHPKECQLKKEDYFECLHHRKEVRALASLLAACSAYLSSPFASVSPVHLRSVPLSSTLLLT